MTARLPPLADDRLDGSVARLFAELAAGGSAVPPVYRVLAYSPRTVRAWHDFAAPLRATGSVPPGLRELAILRVAHTTGSDRQWRHHRELAVAAGIPPATVDAVRGDPASGPFSSTERAVLRLAGELAAGGAVAEATFAGVLTALGAEQTVELVVVLTYYRGLAGVLAAFGLT